MIHIITGDKGKGKTKALIDKVNNECKGCFRYRSIP